MLVVETGGGILAGCAGHAFCFRFSTKAAAPALPYCICFVHPRSLKRTGLHVSRHDIPNSNSATLAKYFALYSSRLNRDFAGVRLKRPRGRGQGEM